MSFMDGLDIMFLYCVHSVSRYFCRSYLYEISLMIDINVDLYPVAVRTSRD